MRLASSFVLAVTALVGSQVSAQSVFVTGYQPPSHAGTGSCLTPDPVVTNMLIDDWLGYGYLRNQSPRVYPGGPAGSVYTPAYPGLFSHHCPLWFPLRPVFCLLGAATHPWHAPPHGYSGWHGGPPPAWSRPPAAAPVWGSHPGWGAHPGWAPQPGWGAQPGWPGTPACPPPCPPNPCPPNPCQPVCPPVVCQPVCPPVPVRVPVTTCRPVTIDDGYYQQVWVSRPRTIMVPETRWQTQWVQPGGAMSAPASPCPPGQFPGTPTNGEVIPSDPSVEPGVSMHVPGTSGWPVPTGQPHAALPSAGRFSAAGDIFGDHELSATPTAGRPPVIPNAWTAAPRTIPTSTVQRFPVTAQTQRRYTSAVH